MMASGIASLLQPDAMMANFARLGYPAYIALILGFWKVSGALAILAPRLARLKEWAYAGFCFHLTGAIASHMFAHDALKESAPAAALLLLGALAYARHRDVRFPFHAHDVRQSENTGSVPARPRPARGLDALRRLAGLPFLPHSRAQARHDRQR